MSWLFLVLAGIMEIFGVIAMKKFTTTNKKIFLLIIAFLFILSFGFLSQSMLEIPMATAYAIWTGIGAAGGVVVGIFFFKESKSFAKILFLGIIIISSIALKAIS